MASPRPRPPRAVVAGADGVLREVPTRAALLAGADAARLLAPRGPGARAAMEASVAPFLHAKPPAAVAQPAAPRPAPKVTPRVGPSRGAAWKVTVAGHRVTLRTVETDGGLSEIALSLAKDGAAFRGVLDALCTAVNTGLAAGVSLDEYVSAFAYTRFGPAGAVEGDPAIARASSVLDWAFRRLALDHLGGPALPDPTEEECGPDAVGPAGQQLPLLPDLPATGAPSARRRALKLVG
ncbi:hypothetical protein ACE7GA_16730 [Roseomonas sp. CCTCC AB2023176]|uniref:TSCPD domain-containing protein n=1 Tax=Roseomonas sp. CCTCC AB2023176 TaxID=3342640 RepID=UPI0035D948E7